MSGTFRHLTEADAKELGRGNRDGWDDYVMMRPPRVGKQAAITTYERGYVAGYRIAARGGKPMMLK